jgi:Xaa-Pro aminopeptidase
MEIVMTQNPDQESGSTQETPQHDQPLQDRVNNRSMKPNSDAFKTFMGSSWAPAEDDATTRLASADFAADRRKALSARFPGERLVIPAGPLKVRSNDCDYRFRPHSGFAHMTGLGQDHEPDAVLVMDPTDPGEGDNGSRHKATLYFRPMAGRDTAEFYSDARSGEFWIGPRPTLDVLATMTGIPTAHMDQELEDAITVNAGNAAFNGVSIRLVRGADETVDAVVDTSRYNTGVDLEQADALDGELIEALSELRLVKDDWEIEQLRAAVDATANGFDNVIASLPRAHRSQARRAGRGGRLLRPGP